MIESIKVRSPYNVYVPPHEFPPLTLCPPALVSPYGGGNKSPTMSKGSRENPEMSHFIKKIQQS